MIRFPILFAILYWAGWIYLLFSTVAVSDALFPYFESGDRFWLVMAAFTVLMVAVLAVGWYTQKFRCLICGEQRARRELHRHR